MISASPRKILALVITLALAFVTAFPAYAQAASTTTMVIEPFETTITACSGEDVTVSGELLLIFHTTTDASGGLHSTFTLVPRDVRGVGSVSGIQYMAVGGQRAQSYEAAGSAPLNATFTSMFNLVSQGGTDNLQIRASFHVTIDANGEETVNFDRLSQECVG